MTKVVDILGTKYKVSTGIPVSKDRELIGRFGYCSFCDHRIVVADLATVDGWMDEPAAVKSAQEKATLRHEVIHAFLSESGLRGSSSGTDVWALNEEMVDWFALQLPKMMKVFEQLGCAGV